MHYMELKCQIGTLWNKSQKCKLYDTKNTVVVIWYLPRLFLEFVV